jgi:hypothetical protein
LSVVRLAPQTDRLAIGSLEPAHEGSRRMDQRIAIGTGAAPARPIHGACVVAGCWCGSATAGSRAAGPTIIAPRRSIRVLSDESTSLTAIALRSVGLPVV